MSGENGKRIRPEKNSIVAEFRQYLDASSYFFLIDYKGLSVGQIDDLRSRLREHEAEFHVVKNRLLKRVIEDLSLDGVGNSLSGPTGVVFGDGDIGATAKVIKRFLTETDLDGAKAGAMGSRVLSSGDISELADLPSKHEMHAIVVGTLAAPMQQIAGVMHQKIASVVYVIKAIEEKKSQAA